MQQKSGRDATNWGSLGKAVPIIFMLVLNGIGAILLPVAVKSAQRVAAEQSGRIVVSNWFFDAVRAKEAFNRSPHESRVCHDLNGETYCYDSVGQPVNQLDYEREARAIAEDEGGSRPEVEQKLREALEKRGASAFISKKDAVRGIAAVAVSGPFPAMIGSLVLLWWGVMLVCQGEGLDLDLQRRRHPMWEWLLSHPVKPGAVFFAEMLSPIAANPMYWGAPLFVAILYGLIYDVGQGALAGLVVGIPVTIAAACMGKALEIGITLRFSPRSRGAIIGIMSWLGYAAMMFILLGFVLVPRVVGLFARFAVVFAIIPWPWLRLFLGGSADGSFSFAVAIFTCWAFAGATLTASVWFSVWATRKGLAGNFGQSDAAPSASPKGDPRFGREPLYRKEFLWFVRDRSAVVQAILIPLTVAGFQLFNLRGLLNYAQGAWNYLCGVAILFGTYFLWVLGPKSLSSEGTALWIALTWPRGLESLLKAKAWLWSLISSGLVALVLCYAAYVFPHEIWKIVTVGIAWFFFGRSMAEKSVTLVTVASSSGEQEKIPSGRRWAAQLGMLTFAIGVLTQQWHVAVMGIVYSYITAAAMWQNFRARLPYLYDPWSEQLPPPPTLMHAMVAISILVEAGAVVSGIMLVGVGRENLALARAMSYAVCSVAVSVGVWHFLEVRNVSNRDVWRWEDDATRGGGFSWIKIHSRPISFLLLLLVGTMAGALLGLLAHGYTGILNHIPAASELIRKSQEQMNKIPNLRLSYGIIAVLFAPFAEEYLFRGLMFRALDREWGGWRAVVGAAAFFAVYHPALAWPPVFLLGACNALLFKKTGRLAPAVALHMAYNAVVLFA
ncbi:MAG TPA: CPBP family glutamic-type intramembrane protease [Terriglobales bacterium]|nr:CPBP family glutamic-type intramembrane protease [Terriglobales bacterium]